MTFVWLTPLIVFALFTGVILFQESVRRRAFEQYDRESADINARH